MGKMTEEHKAKMAAGREKARLAKLKTKPTPQVMAVPEGVEVPKKVEVPTAPPLNPPSEQANDSMTDLVMKLMREVEDLKRANPNTRVTPEGAVETLANMANVGNQGVQGRVFKYPVEKGYYPDPTDRLYDDVQLKKFAMRENFYFKWEVEGETYEKYGITYTEPRFIVELWRYMWDENGDATGQMYLVNRQIQHEDELVARVAADKLGLAFDTHEELLNEMRYYRIRQWLLGVFTPVKVNQYKKKSNTMVVDGKVVEVTDTEERIESEMGIAQAQSINYQTRVN